MWICVYLTFRTGFLSWYSLFFFFQKTVTISAAFVGTRFQKLSFAYGSYFHLYRIKRKRNHITFRPSKFKRKRHYKNYQLPVIGGRFSLSFCSSSSESESVSETSVTTTFFLRFLIPPGTKKYDSGNQLIYENKLIFNF
jgi:hypothetical protein